MITASTAPPTTDMTAPPPDPRTEPSQGLTIRPDSISNLSPTDQELFTSFGVGPSSKPDHVLIHRAFGYWAARQPTATAVEHLGTSITYAELEEQSNHLAAVLVNEGVKRGDNVALFLRRSIPMVVGILATLKTGATYVPQDVMVAPESQLRHVVEQTKATVILTTSSHLKLVPTIESTVVIPIDAAVATTRGSNSVQPTTALDEMGMPDDDCFVLFTSGTTGAPNGVRVSHRNLCNILLTKPGNLGIEPGMTVAQILSISFDMAAWETLGALTNGARLLIRGSDIEETASQADVIIATPSVLGSLNPANCQRASIVAVAGEPCPQPLADTWSAFATFHNSCGPTETTIVNTIKRYDPAEATLTIGTPTPNNTVYILDEDLQPLPVGEVGEMWAGGDCVTSGYLNNALLTTERYKPDPFLGSGKMMFRTRDLGRWTVDGELEHHGRTDDQVKIRGFRVELDSVSTVLESVNHCKAAVTLKLDSRHLVAFVAPSTVDPAQAQAQVATALPYYCVPSAVYAIDELPRTTRGKIDKRKLLDLAKQTAEATSLEGTQT